MVRVVREDTQGIRVIKALSKVEKEQQRYDKVNKKLINAEKKASLAMGFVNPIMSLLMNLGITFVVLIGAYRVMNRQNCCLHAVFYNDFYCNFINYTNIYDVY